MGGLANQAFGMGRQINQDMMQQGMMQQALQQQLMDRARQQYQGFTGAPEASLSLPLAALGAAPVPQSKTTSQSPGLFNYLSMGASLAGAFCWVAREVYGPDNPEWLDFREWMLTKAPTWLRNAYVKHGPKVAEFVRRNPWTKRVLKPLMDWAKS